MDEREELGGVREDGVAEVAGEDHGAVFFALGEDCGGGVVEEEERGYVEVGAEREEVLDCG